MGIMLLLFQIILPIVGFAGLSSWVNANKGSVIGRIVGFIVWVGLILVGWFLAIILETVMGPQIVFFLIGMLLCFAVMFMGAAGSLSKLIIIEEGGKSLGTTGTINIVISLALGGLIGEIIDIDGLFQRFGAWLRHKSGNDSDNQFINGFVTASLTVGIGAMGIMGSINDGIYGDYAILAAKATIDFVIILVMASSMGKGCAFSSITVLVTQGSITALAAAFGGMLTDAMLTNIAMTGGILIFCIGINLVWENTIKVANLLPALVVTCIIALI
jgi:uncharacterized membrane protein YqgA involved in biofilm formation